MELMPGYQHSDVGVIPDDWDAVPLSQTAKRITRGASPRPIDSPVWFDSRSSVGWVRISDVTRSGRYLTETTQRLSEEGIRRSRPVPSGSLIMSICATVGRPIETRIDTCIHDGFVVFDQPSIDQSYLYHVLAALETTWSKHGQTGSQMNLNTGLINSCLIPLPPTETEQRAIAQALSDADEMLAALDQLIAKKRDLKRAAMQQLLTGKTRLPGFSGDWTVRQLKHVAPLQRGFDLPNRELRNGPYPVVYSNGVLNHHAEFQVQGPGVVTGRSGTIGKVTYLEDSYWPHNTALWVTSFENNDPRFIFYLYTQIGLERFATGSGVPTLNRNDVHDFEVAIPPTSDEQSAIATVLTDLDAEIFELESRRDKTRNIKQAMMQELLTGKTRLIAKEGSHV